MGRLVFLSQVFYPDPQSTSQLFSALLAALARDCPGGTVLCGRPPGREVPRKETWEGIQIERIGPASSPTGSMAGRLIGYLRFSLALCRRLFSLGPEDQVLACTNPPFLPALVFLVSRWRGWRYRLFLLDLYPEGLERLALLRSDGPVVRLWRRVNRSAYRKAHQIAVLGRDMKELVVKNYGLPAGHVQWVPHWSATPIPTPVTFAESRLVHRLGLENFRVIQYSGNMGLWHDLENLVRAASLLQDRKEIRFLLAGQGRRKPEAQALASQLGLTNILWIDPVPLDELDDLLAACHAAVISQREGLTGVAVPCKLYGILASGRPILGAVPATSEVARVIEEENCGEVLPPHHPQALADRIRKWVDEPESLEAMGRRAREAYERKYTLAAAARNFRNWLQS